MINSQDREIQQYRDLMSVPDRFDPGFGLKTVVGSLFLGLLMVPGSIYLSLFIGGALMGTAARWVTVILFAEVARRSMSTLRRQEVFILFYMTGIALGGHLAGGVMTTLLWNQYMAQSDIMTNFAIDLPTWVAPSAEAIKASGNTFFTREWAVPILFLAGMFIIQRIDGFGLGYALYRLTAHVEKLPFPMAPVGALGITALAEDRDPANRWRWRCFSLGGVIGLAFGFIYIGLPAVSGAIFNEPIMLIPIPWLDLTAAISTENRLPALPINIVFDVGLIIAGMILPFWAVIGGLLGLIITVVLNPMLYHEGVLTTWQPGMNMVRTLFSNHIDFYLSFGIGLALAIFAISIGSVFSGLFRRARSVDDQMQAPRRKISDAWQELTSTSKERGDFSFFIGVFIYLFSTFTYISISTYLIPEFPWMFFLLFALAYQPMMSYVNAKLEGLVGQTVQIPMVREAAFILSGYTGSAIWFAPIPLNDYGGQVRTFREMELTGTRISSLIKTELVVIPTVIICSLAFSQFIWQMGPIPDEKYPFAQEYWDFLLWNQALTYTATAGGASPFLEAIKFDVISWGLGAGLVAFAVLSFLNLPTFLVFGVVRGMGQTTPGNVIPEVMGALIGRFYLEKKFGHQKYKQYVMVLGAGFGAGMGLIGMAAVAIALITKSTAAGGF